MISLRASTSKKMFDANNLCHYYEVMKNQVLISLVCLCALFSCAGTPQPEPDVPPDPVIVVPDDNTLLPPNDVTPEEEVVATFDTVTITKATFLNTKSEIQVVVETLNTITFARDYNKWLTFLSDEYRATYSDPATLDSVSASLPIKGVQLKNLKDYFMYVFVPSRQNMRVDDIQFVSPTRVYVLMEISPGSQAAIYILEKFNGFWQLVLKN